MIPDTPKQTLITHTPHSSHFSLSQKGLGLLIVSMFAILGCPSSPTTKPPITSRPVSTPLVMKPAPFRKQYAFPAYSLLSPARGSQHAPLQIVELFNPLSPLSRQIQQIRPYLWEKFPGLLRWTIRFNPSLQKDRAYFYARAFYASYRLGIFWSFVEQFFSQNKTWNDTELLHLAQRCGVDPQAFELKLFYAPYKMLLDRDMRWGHALGLSGESRIFVNGALLNPPYTRERLVQALEWAIQRSHQLTQQGVPPEQVYSLWIKAGTPPRSSIPVPSAIRKRQYIHVPFEQLEAIPVRGPGDAPVSIVEYSDFTCVPCRTAYFSLHQLLHRYPKHLRFYFKYFPIGIHAESQRSAELAAAAQEQQKFWPLYDILFQKQQRLFAGDLVELARQAGMDPQWISGELDRGSYRRRVLINQLHGRKLGVHGVPTILIDGRAITGTRHLSHLIQVAEQELWKAGVLPASPQKQP